MGAFLRSDRPPVTASAAPPRNRAVSAPYGADRTILAAAEKIDLQDPKDRISARQRPYAEWQREAWEGYEHVGEVHYGFNLLANLLSRARLYAGQIGQANEAPVDLSANTDKGKRKVSAQLAKAASAAVDDLLNGGGTDLIRNYALNMSVPGECYLVHMPRKNGTKFWTIRSCDELDPLGDGWRLNPMRNTAAETTTLPKETFVARMWRMNPRYSREPDSSMIGVRNPIKTLLMLERLMRTSIRSRLNAGILFVPDTITSSLAANQTASEVPIEEPGSMEELAKAALQDDGGQLIRDMIETFSAPITDETNAASLVPMLLKGPQDAGEKIKHILLTRPSDDWLMGRAEHALERVLNGIDIPKEVVTGLQAVKYSNAVVIDENLYKSNIEPLALALVDGLTLVYLRPKLIAMGFPPDEVAQLVIWYDPSDIVTRPNSADDATEGLDRGLLTGTAWRREHGFAETDAPGDDELMRIMLSKAQVLPEQVVLAMVKSVFKDNLDLEEFTKQPQQPPQSTGEPADVLPFGRAKAPPADPQRTAVQQVGVR